ncbi:unnamed protein product, partial [Amoebophrya sp. A25]|eukprot:GSA25T00016839001.1
MALALQNRSVPSFRAARHTSSMESPFLGRVEARRQRSLQVVLVEIGVGGPGPTGSGNPVTSSNPTSTTSATATSSADECAPVLLLLNWEEAQFDSVTCPRFPRARLLTQRLRSFVSVMRDHSAIQDALDGEERSVIEHIQKCQEQTDPSNVAWQARRALGLDEEERSTTPLHAHTLLAKLVAHGLRAVESEKWSELRHILKILSGWITF